jgi:4-aminobutyrate aminotransferase/(S)-3-amino-2-methylpropionate transaminase
MTTNAELLARRQAAVPRGPFHVAPIFADRALGALIWDVEGREYIDFCGGIGTMNVGHSHPEVIRAIREQSERLTHTCFHVAMYEPYIRLAERLNALVPISGPCKTSLFNSGAEAVENAVKIARAATGRTAVAAFERGYHGRTLLTMTMTGKCRPYTAGFGPFAPEVYRLPYQPFFAVPETPDAQVERDVAGALHRLEAYSVEPEALACLVVEPVLGEGGFLPIHAAALGLLRRWCSDQGVVLVCDEVQTGFGRCGAMFASERYGVEPDLITLAKSLAGGLVLSGVTGRAELMDAPGVGGIGGTFGGNPLSCAAANAVLDIMESQDLPARARAIGARVMASFEALAARHDQVGAARGLGAMCGLEIVDPASGEPAPARAAAICLAARERGLLVMTASGNVIRTLMPLTISDELLDRGLAILEAAVTCSGEEDASSGS